MAEAIFGEQVIIEMLVDSTYEPILCGTDCVFTRTPELIETTTPTSGLFKEFMIRREEWDITVSGLTKVANNAALTFFYMLQTSVRRLTQTVRITFTDVDGADIQISGEVLIGPESISGPSTDFAQCSIELKGTGAFTIGSVTPPDPESFDALSDYWQTVAGQNYISGASSGEFTGTAFTIADTDTIIDVDVEGTGYNHIQGTPTDGERECHYNSTTDRLEFPSDLIFDGNQRVFVEIKRPV